jgi:hypothetical protein
MVTALTDSSAVLDVFDTVVPFNVLVTVTEYVSPAPV